MDPRRLNLVIPTYRLREVGETVERYDDCFWRSGHTVPIVVFDDSTWANQQKYFGLLEQTRTHGEVWYVGPREKARFLEIVLARLGDRKLESVVKNLFRPSYGGNRNFTLIYTLGGMMLSSDDDMRPEALTFESMEALEEHEISRGRLVKAASGGFVRRSFDLVAAFTDVLGKKVADIPSNYVRGDYLVDSAMDLETNATKGLTRENSVRLIPGKVADSAVVKMAQTFRTGTNDIDALDFVEMFLADEAQTSLDELNDLYVLENFRPVVTKKNWRMDCGVAGYDNTSGLPPFFPTRLRFEDYIYRLWIQQSGIVSAHVDAVQNHTKSNYMRNPPAAEVFNEEICNLLKRKIKDSGYKLDELGIRFEYDGEVSSEDTEAILERVRAVHDRVVVQAARTTREPRRAALAAFAENLSRAFYGFEGDFFQQNVARIVDDVVSQIRGSIELWPTLVEICYFHKHTKELPKLRVRNKKQSARAA
ncbi:MAG: hypothetical protein ACXWUG_22385 [Polyangiales bacterium]